jgi:predicted NAD-dependent protein-ADP-ribosyltransferase YbiA (DUF1768 family)
MVSNVGDQLPSPFDVSGNFAGLGSPAEQPDGQPKSFRSGALHNIGVNWAESTSDEQRPFLSRLGFYDLDYDTKGRRGVELGKGTDYIEAANVFGRQFTRAELDKDDEGRKLVKLMEAQRTGSHQEAGFWKGISDWNLGNVPWLGWMMDIGSTVSETVSISKTMRKMQNGEAVSNHEAIAVRRFMLQQELESQRSTSYQIGSTIRASVPFVVEIAGAAAMTAAAAKAGAWVGGAIAGIGSGGVLAPVGAAVGGAIGAVGGFIFGGGALLSKLFKGGAKKFVTKIAVNPLMEKLAGATFTEGISRLQRREAVKFAAEATGRTTKEISKLALKNGMDRASENVGRELATKKLGEAAVKDWTAEQFAAYAAKNATTRELRQRGVFEASKWVGETYKDVADIAMDARLARTFLVNGDVANMVERGWVATLEKAILDKVYSNAPRAAKEGFWTGIKNYWAERAAVRKGLDKLTDEDIANLKKTFLTSMMDKAAGRPSAVSAVTASISQSLGGQAVSKGYASGVAEYLVNNATRSFMLKYEGKGFVNGATRVARWVGDGILDGMLRWDTSIYHGAGTIARSGTVLGGKMAAFKEALKVSFVEAPVRGAMQLGMQMPMWPVVAAATGNSPGDFVVRGQLSTQATALQTGDKQMMDNARAIAIGSGLVEYISETSGRGFNLMMEGIASPVLKNAPFMKATKELGSYMSRKLESVFGTQEMMKFANRSRLVDAVSSYLGRKAAEGARLPNLTRTQVEQLVAGVKDVANVGDVLKALELKSEKALVQQAMMSQLGLSKMRAGMTYFVAHNMLERGITPQKMAAWLQRVGYDGVIAEMAEERYGGFFQGLMGLDGSPSDSTMRDRWSAAMRGLFPDPHQLLVEAVSFSFPAMTQLTMNSLYSHLGRGVVQETLDDAKSVSVHQNTVPEITVPVESAEGAQALAAYHAGVQERYDKATVGEGGEEKAWNDVLGHGRTAADSVDKEFEQAARAGLAVAIADIEGPEVDAAGNMTGLRKRAKRLDMTKDFDREIVEDEIEHILSHAGSAEDAAARGNMYGAPQIALMWLREEWTRRHATAEALPTRAQAVKAAVANGSLKLNEKNKDISDPKVSDEEMEVLLREKAQRIIDLSNNEEELNKQLADHQAEEVFGKDGVEAIKRLKRKDPDYMDSVKQKALGEGSEYAEFVKNVPNIELRSDADADSVASEITAALPFISNDSAMTAEVRERLSVKQGVQFNKFSEDYVGEVAGSLGRLGDKYIQFKYNLGRNQWWGRRAMMRVVGILDAITTGRLELASRNPVQWAMEEAQLPRQLMNDVGQLRERAIQAGRELYLRRRLGDGSMTGEEARKIRESSLADTSADLMEEFRKAGEESYQTSLREYAQMFLTARNVIAVSKGDIEDAALRVVAHNHRDEAGGKVIYRYGDKTTNDFRSAEFRSAVAGAEMEKAKSDIVKGLARLAVSDAVAVNTHARFGNVNTTSITFSYDRAMRFGNNAEVVAAIRAMPAFRNMRAVYDVSDGGHVNDYALGRTIDVGELLNMPTDGRLEEENLRRVMFAMGRYYGEFTEAQNQQAAAQYLSRLRLAVENSEPLSFEYRDGTSADVKTSYGLDKDGRRVVTLTCNGVSVTGHSTLEATRLLETAAVPKADGTRPEVDGVLANWRQFAVLQNDSISSRDATSLVLLMHGTREKAREAYRAFYGHDVDEALYPPQLRRVTRDGADTWLYEDDEEAARGLAAELRSEDEGVRNAVRGNGREGDPMSIGYERAAELMLERHGITRSKQDAAAMDVYRGEASYSIRPNGIAFGDTIYLQSDYYSGGDAEMMLRSAFARAIFDAATKPGKAFDDPSAFVGILQEMDKAFSKAADECVAELEDRNPDMAQRVKDAMASLPSSPGRVDPARLAAIAAAVGVFSDERGVNEYGNGFLFGPELAYVADRARRSPWTLLFLSSMDEALGGRGFFAENADPLQGLGRFVDAFAPSGPALIESRSSALFTNGGEGAKKTGIVFQWYGVPKDLSAAGIAAGVAPVVDESTLTIFNDLENHSVSDLIRTVASHCREFGDAYRKAGGTLSSAEMYRILKHALAGGGETADDTAPSIGSGFGGVSLEVDERVRQPLASDVVPDDVAFGIGRNLLFFAPGAEVGGVGGRAQALKSRSAVRRFLFERGCYESNKERIVNKFIDAAGAEGGAGVSDAALDEEEWTSLADVLSDGSGNQDIFFDAKRANAAIENRDLMDLGRQWSYVYPSEGGAFTQVLARFSNEILRLAGNDGAADELKTLARLFNVLRSKRSGKSGESIAAATGVWNDSSRVAKDTKVTDALLAKAVASLHESGHDELAFVLNGIRNIPAEGKRRAQALALIGYMTPLDVNRVTVGDTGIGTIDTMGSADLATVSSIRASFAHAMARMFSIGPMFRSAKATEVEAALITLDNLLTPGKDDKFYFNKHKKDTVFADKTFEGFESILSRDHIDTGLVSAFEKEIEPLLEAAKECHDEASKSSGEDKAKWLQKEKAILRSPRTDAALVALANAVCRRMQVVADAVDYMFGPGNELAYALRSPGMLYGAIQNVRNADSYENLEKAKDTLLKLAMSCEASAKLKSRCVLLSQAFLNMANAAARRAFDGKPAPANIPSGKYTFVVASGITGSDMLDTLKNADELSRLFARGDPHTISRTRAQWFADAKLPGGVVNSYMGRVFGLYAASAPRSVARMSGVREESLEASSQVTATPASEPVMMAAVEDRLLAKLPAGTVAAYREVPVDVSTKGKGFVNHSGGALGSDSAWGDIGEKYGVRSNHYYKDKTPKGNVPITEDQYKEGLQKVEAAVEPLGRKIPYSKPYIVGLLSRNWQQVKNSDAVFAVAQDFDAKGNVLGGTGWAVQMAKAESKPIHVFSQKTGVWYSWNGSAWVQEDTPKLTKNFAGIGTRELDETGRKAIEAVYRNTFGADTERVAGTPKTINVWAGSGENAEFSNLAERPFTYDGRNYLSVEHAYQTLKSGTFDEDTYGRYTHAGVKIKGRLRADTRTNVKLMQDLVYESFRQNPEQSRRLVETGAAKFTHTQARDLWSTEFPKALELAREKLSGNEDAEGAPQVVPEAPEQGTQTVLDDYLARGGRFEDGSRLVTVTAGARLEDGTIVDKAQLSVIVAAANIDRFVKGDVRNGYFEVYHGEKPSVYSISLPRDVMQKILDGIHSGADWAMNRVTRKMVEDGVLPKTIDAPDNRGELYDALFSVVATAARCDQIDPKRTQVLLAQGVPFSTHRDRMLKTTDGKVEEVSAAVSTMDGKAKVTPGLYCDIIVSGTDAAQNLGMYLNHGFLVESQRAQATNPLSVSFKNHLIDWFGAALFKGQGHDFGLGMYETDAVPVSGTLAEACRVQRRRLEEILGIKELTLDLPDPEKPQTDEEKAYRESALKLVEEFLLSSTTLCTDTETLKAGSFSEKCGFSVDGTAPFIVKVGGQELTFSLKKDDNGNLVEFRCTVGDTVVDLLDGRFVIPSFKNSSASLATMLPIIAQVLGKKELTTEDIGSIEAKWRLQTGEATEVKALKDSGIFQSYGTEEGDKVSVVESASGGYRVRYFTRSMNAQVMANSDASAKPSLKHPAATNWSRDVVANSGRLRQMVPEQADFTWYATKALNVSRAVPYAILRSQPDFVRSLIEKDPDLYAAWMAHPNSQEVQEQIVRRTNTAYAKAMKAYVCSMHAVLMGSGIKATKLERNGDGTYDVEYSYSAGVTEYDKGCFRDARVLSQEEKEAFGVGRSYSSGQVNVQSANFRYGWHVKADADFSAIDAYAQGAGKALYDAHMARFDQAYGEDESDNDRKRVAALAVYIEYFDKLHRGEEKENAAKVLGSVFTDYTGKTVGENASCDLLKLSFSDLFLGQRYGRSRFDLAAFEFRGDTHGKKLDRNGNKTIYLGGAFFAGDRRPSGNFESAGGLIRVQSPVLFDRATGKADGHALYILPPLMNTTQGSDTDGDSATGTIMSGKGLTADDRRILDQIHDTVMARMKDLGADWWTRTIRCEDLVNTLRTRFPVYFEEETDEDGIRFAKPSARFHQLIGNVLMQEEIDNYRLMPNEAQTEYGTTTDVNKAASSRTIYDYGLAGRSPVGTKAVSDDIDIQIGGVASTLAAKVLGVPESSFVNKTYYQVFKKCIDKLSLKTMPELDLLNPRVAAYLSWAAADAGLPGMARARAVALQAALEHLTGYADTDPRVRALAPALFEEYDGYRPAEDFIGHLDKISNALFDVVKDLFAPRASWQASLLNCLVSRLLADANAEYKAWADGGRRGNSPKWDDEWFFVKLVGFAQELHASDTTLPSLIAKGAAFADYAETNEFVPGKVNQTLLGAYNTMLLRSKDCIAKTAFKGLYMVRNGRLDLTDKGQVKDVSGQARLTKGLTVKNAGGEWVSARGPAVLKGIQGLMSSIARALRMREPDFVDAEERDLALALGWQPATAFMDEKLCNDIADVMEGKVDGRVAVRDPANKVAIGLRFLAAKDVPSALEEAQRDLRAFQALNDVLDIEDGLSPDTVLKNGGSRASGQLKKIESAQQGGAAVANEMTLVYLGSKLRMEDIASGMSPLAADRSIGRDLDAIEGSPSDWNSYLSRTGQKPMSTTNSKGDPANDEALLFMAAASFAGDYVDTGVVQANRLNLSHLLGCVHAGVQKFGGTQYSQLILGKYRTFASVLNTLVEDALNFGTVAGMSRDVADMLTMLRPNVNRNTVDLVLRASADAAKVLRAGFQELAANQNAVGGGFTGAGLAACIQLSMCANSQFDPARDSNVRANVSAMFGEEVDEWERWGAAVPQNPVLRQLCRVPRVNNGRGYNLFAEPGEDGMDPALARKVAAVSGMPEVTDADLNHPATQSLTTPFAILNYIAMTDYTSPHALHDEAAESDPRFLPGGEQRRKIESMYEEGKSHTLRPQTVIPGVRFRGPSGEFETVEEAVNDIVNERLAAFSADKSMTMWLTDPRNLTKAFHEGNRTFNRRVREIWARSPETAERLLSMGRRRNVGQKRALLSYDLVVDEVLERAWIDYGEQFAEWARNAAFDGGGTLSTLSSPMMRYYLGAFVQAHAETALEAPSVGTASVDPSFTVQRMQRGGFFQFLKGKHPEDMDRFVHDPETNIRGALEAVFGDWSKETGCKVERVMGKDGVPMNLLKITRKIKLKDSLPEPRPVSYSREERASAYKALASKEYADAHPKAVEIARDMLRNGVPVSTIDAGLFTKTDLASWPVTGLTIHTKEDAANLCRMLSNPYFEVSKLLFVDEQGKVISGVITDIGSADSTRLRLKDVEKFIPPGAFGVIASHNHPVGSPEPSAADSMVLPAQKKAFEKAGIKFLDHIITDTTQSYSMEAGGFDYVPYKMGEGVSEWWRDQEKTGSTVPKPTDPFTLVNVADQILALYEGKLTSGLRDLAQTLSTHDKRGSFIAGMDAKGRITGITRLIPGKMASAIEAVKEAGRLILFVGSAPFDRKELADAVRTDTDNQRGSDRSLWGVYSLETGYSILTPDNSDHLYKFTYGEFTPPSWEDDNLESGPSVSPKKPYQEVVTYISYGDYLSMKANNANYNQAILNALNDGAARQMTMEELMSLTEEERVALANVKGLRVKGESVKASRYLGTRALMALTGLVRLSDVSDYHTLFHEYFHQMLDFYRKTGICTAEDEAALLKKYRTADGRFDEEAAADAFANYVTQGDAVVLRGKLLLSGFGGDEDRVFAKFKRTAQAFLSGALAYDSLNVPVFMQMMISADFSQRDMKEMQDFDDAQRKKIESLLLGEFVDFGTAERWDSAEGELAKDNFDLFGALVDFRHGSASMDDVKRAAAKLVEDSKKPENRVTFSATMNIDRPPVSADVAKPEPGPTLAQRISDPAIPVGDRVSLLFKEALKRIDNGTSESADLTTTMNRFRDLSDIGEAAGPDFDLATYTARRALNHVCEMLGVNIWEYAEDGTKSLNDLGRQLMSDEKIAGFIVRLVHEYSVKRASENDYADGLATVPTKDMGTWGPERPVETITPAQFASADYVMGNMLAGVVPSKWTEFCRGRAEASRDLFIKAAEDLEARAAAMRARFPDGDIPEDVERDAKWLELQGADARHRAHDVVRFVTAVMNGEPLKGLILAMGGDLKNRQGWSPKQDFSNYYGYLLQYITGAARMERQNDGTVKYAPGKAFGFHNAVVDFSSRFVQEAIDAAAKALGVAQVVRRYVKENGVDQPAPGESVSIPVSVDDAGTEEPLAVPPAEGVMSPDLHPQLILQLPGSWQASDLQKQFYGGSFRDMMTDVSLNAAVEETNRLANRIDFYLGANCLPGESANEIEEATSELGLEDGLFTAEEKNKHFVRRVAGVRGYMLGLVNRAAKTKGRAMTQEDVNLVHFVSQAVACLANGHDMYTGYDIPYVNRTILDGLLSNVKNVAELEKATAEGGVYSPKAVFDRIYGHVTSAGRPSNLDQLLCRVLEGVPRSVLGWKNGKFRKDGIYCKILEAFYITGRVRTDGIQVGDSDFHQRVAALLMEAGLADKSAASGRVVLTIPVTEVKKAWEAEDSYRQELIDKCGRRAELLDIDYLAEVVAAEANRLNKVAGRSRWLTDSAIGTTLSGMARGLWFEAGTGHHQAIVDHMKNARELFRGYVSPDEQLRNRFAALQDTLRSHNKVVTHRVLVPGPDGKLVEKKEDKVQGNLLAFEIGRDGQLANISNRQLMYLGRLLGLGRRADTDEFLKRIRAGQYTKINTSSIYGFDIRPGMTVFEFDRLIFDVMSAHLVTEAKHPDDPGHTPLTRPYDGEDGGLGYGHQQLVDAYYLHGQLQQKLMDDMESDKAVRGRICSMSEQTMFRTQGRLGSAKSATERLRSMAQAITHAERFRGCLAQMLTTVGTDGAPNFIVKPGEYAQDLVPDEFWQATSRFVLDRMSKLGKMKAYDAGKSGLDNMRDIADAAAAFVLDTAKDGAKPRYHLLPPNELGADMLFDSILCANDDASDDVNILTKFANGRVMHPNGSEAEGYMRQLFGMVTKPTVWAGHRILDRVMSYSKAASVGLSAFFAFATRFESPVAACGFWNTAMGFRKNTAKLARRLAKSKLGEALGFRKNLPYLADFLEAITSDDPSIQYMRELCDMINMPLTDSVMNPLTEKQGAIDADIDRISRWLMAEGHTRMAKELRSAMKAAFHNPGEYAFSNVLNGVKMAVVAQTMFRLREECEHAGRPFDPVRELRRHSVYLNAEIGGIQPERYAFLTPGMQQLLRLSMFSYQWTLGAWVAGSGEVVSDILFGGHNTTQELRRFAFIRWLRMLGIVKVGVPVFMQLAIKALATALVKSGMVGDPDDPDDKDPLGIDDMPWLCFYNESKVGSLAFDVTPITKLLGRNETLVDIKNKRGAWPVLTSVLGTVAGAALTRKWWGALAGGFAGQNIGALIPASEGVGRGANTTGRRRQYMHFGKQNDEFWRWFTDGWMQATSKMSIPLQKVVEAFFGSTSGQDFGKKFAEKSLTERFFNTSLDPSENALVNFLTGFAPFSAASVAGHPDTGVLGMMGPVNQGTSKTRSQKEVRRILTDFVRDNRHNDPWSFTGNRQNLTKLCSLALKEARMNGLDPDELLTSALGQVTSQEYIRLFEALPRTKKDEVDARTAKAALRALYRVNRKRSAILQSIKKKYKNAGVDWSKQKNAAIRAAVKNFLGESRADPWVSDDDVDELFERHFAEPSFQQLRSVDVQQDRKGGEAFSNFLATDDVPETLFGIPVVSQDYTEKDLEFFKRNPKAAGFYDLGDDNEEPPPEEPPPEEPPPDDGGGGGGSSAAAKGGKAEEFMKRNPSLFSHVKSFEKMREEPYEDVGGYAIGYGAHLDKDGNPVTKDTAAIDEATATLMLARDLYARREKLAKMLPNWSSIPGNARQALLDVAMGKDSILSASKSKGLHDDLTAAGKDAEKLLNAVKKHYYSYLTKDPEYREGLMNRRVAGGKLFFGEDFSYDGKTWDAKLGFVKKGGK